MSLGPSSLGNLLAQRLDTVLGISQSGQARTGAHPDALRQTQPTNRLIPTENQNQRGQQADRALGDKAAQAGERDKGAEIGRQDPRVASQLQRFITDSRFTQSAPTTLGRTARTILALLSTQQGNQPVQGKAPLLQPRQLAQAASGPTALASVFMQALSQNVQQSGMFYESHLAQLVKGQTTLSQLQQQPQAQAHLQAASDADGKTSGAKQAQQSLQAAQTAASLQQSGIDPSTQQIVRQQLEVLANQLFAWRGEAWPGAPMELEVQRRQEEQGDTDQELNPEDENHTPWQTRLRVKLPNLGEVEARLYMNENALRLHLRAPQSAEHLNINLQPLVQRLQAQGIDIEQLQVAASEIHDEP